MSQKRLYKHLLGTALLKKEVWTLTEEEFNTMNKARRKAYRSYRQKRLLDLFDNGDNNKAYHGFGVINNKEKTN